MNIVVLSGGTSSERDVSLRSGQAVAAALSAAGHTVEQADPSRIALTKEWAQPYDLAFPVLHGTGGEDGELQGKLDAIHLAYVGSGQEASQLCFNKWDYRQFVETHDVPLAAGELVDSDSLWHSDLVKHPFVLKPFDGGSSIDTFIVRDPAQVPRDSIAAAFQRHPQLLLEQLISGTEITVGVVGTQPLPVIEIIPPADGEFDYENKYNGATRELCPPRHIATSLQDQAQALAARIHSICGCKDLSRTDMMVTTNGDFIVLETNTLPGLTPQSLLPKAAATAGLPMSELCDHLVQLAASRQIATV